MTPNAVDMEKGQHDKLLTKTKRKGLKLEPRPIQCMF